jgi:hypothetical protein
MKHDVRTNDGSELGKNMWAVLGEDSKVYAEARPYGQAYEIARIASDVDSGAIVVTQRVANELRFRKDHHYEQ